MELSELTAYAEKKFHMREQHKWSEFPGFSVLADPNTGKWVALLMRQWDFDTGMEIQRCDMKCGRQCLSERSAAYLSMPFRMKGEKWVGVRFEDSTDPDVVYRLLDRAVYSGEGRGYTIVLEETAVPPTMIQGETAVPHTTIQRGTAVSHATIQRGTAVPHTTIQEGMTVPPTMIQEKMAVPHTTIQEKVPVPPTIVLEETPAPRTIVCQDTAIPPAGTRFSRAIERVPDKIRAMKKLYGYRNGSFAEKCRNFYRQGKFMEDYEDDAPWDGAYRHYFPTYHDLDIRQLRGYFTWRTRVRKGEFSDIAVSLAYLYLYELLNGIGTSSAEDGLKKMQEFEAGFLDSGMGDPTMRRNLHRWMLEYAVVHNVLPEVASNYIDSAILEKDQALAILRNPKESTDKELFSALCTFAGKKLEQSQVIKKGKEKGIHLFAEVWRHTAEAAPFREGKIFFTECFGEQKSYPWRPLANAVYWEKHPHPNADYVLDPCRSYHCRRGVWQEERYDNLYFDRKRFHALLHETDRQLRRYLKTGYYLQENPEEAWAAPYVEQVLEAERQAEIEAAKPKITINLSNLDQIRHDALLTRDSLLTEEEMDRPEDNRREKQQQIGEFSKLGRAAIRGKAAQPERIAIREEVVNPGRTAIKEEGAVNLNRTAVREEAVTPESTTIPKVASEGTAQMEEWDFSDPTDSAFPALSEPYKQILWDLLHGNSVDAYLRENYLMPSVVADSINEAFFDEIGDNVLECDGDTIAIVEDYKEEILQMLGGKDR